MRLAGPSVLAGWPCSVVSRSQDDATGKTAALRQRAEDKLRQADGTTVIPDDGTATLRQLHDLQVHKIELEMQNLELQRTRAELEASLERYVTLYDFAPTGYVTLDRNGVIRALNLNAAAQLGVARSQLVGRRLVDFIAAGSRPGFSSFLAAVFAAGSGARSGKVLLRDQRPLPRIADLNGVADASGETCQVALIDVSERERSASVRKQAETRARELVAQNRMLTQRMFNLEEIERREIARELHDELGQWLTGIGAEAEAIISAQHQAAEAATMASARAIRDSTAHVQKLIKHMLHRLRPRLTETLGLVGNLETLIADWRRHQPQVQCELTVEGEFPRLRESLAITAYRVVQEALNNVAQHARASQVSIRLRRTRPETDSSEGLLLAIQDDGRGMDVALPHAGFGLMGMRERVIANGGELSVTSAHGQGVRITAQLPLHPRAGSGEVVSHDAPA